MILRWFPSILMMVLIFGFSSLPSKEMPNFAWADLIVKKGGHMLGYALLALAYWRGLGWDKKRWWLPWLMTFLYAVTDEFHQSFVPGRNPSPLDVGIDCIGAGIGLIVWKRFYSNK
jgi:VanZ family protein